MALIFSSETNQFELLNSTVHKVSDARKVCPAILVASLLPSYLLAQPAATDFPTYRLARTVALSAPSKTWFLSHLTTARPVFLSRDNQLLQEASRGDFEPMRLASTGEPLSVTVSRAGGYFAILGMQSQEQDNKILLITVYNARGERLYQLSWQRHFDTPYPLLSVSDRDGSLVVGHADMGRLMFYDKAGTLVKKHDLFPGAEYGLERVMAMDRSLDGDLVVGAGKRGASPLGLSARQPSAEPAVIFYTSTGTERLRKELSETNAAALAVSDDGEFVSVAAYTAGVRGNVKKRTVLLRNTGQEITTLDLLPKQMQFSADSRFLLLAEKQQVALIATASGKMLWTRQIGSDEGMIAAVTLASDAMVAALLLARNEFRRDHFVFTHGRLKLFDFNGNITQNIMLNPEAVVMPAAVLAPDGTNLSIGFETSYQTYTRE